MYMIRFRGPRIDGAPLFYALQACIGLVYTVMAVFYGLWVWPCSVCCRPVCGFGALHRWRPLMCLQVRCLKSMTHSTCMRHSTTTSQSPITECHAGMYIHTHAFISSLPPPTTTTNTTECRHMRACVHVRACTRAVCVPRAHACTRARARTHAYARTRTHARTHTHTRARACTHTHTHTHTYM